MSVTVSIDTSKYDRAVAELLPNLKKEEGEALRDEMGLLVKELIILTPPFGLGTDARKKGEGAVSRDVLKVFGGMPSKELNFFKDRIKNLGPFHQEGIFFENDVNAARHEGLRDRRGRVSIKRAQQKKVGRFNLYEKTYVPAARLKAYIKEKMSHVGRAKAGWLAAAIKFGTSRVPAWVSRHGGQGAFRDTTNSNGILLEAINRNRAINNLNEEARILDNAYRGRTYKIRERLERILSARAKRFSRG